MEEDKYMICPENHFVPFPRENFARDFSDGERDAMTLNSVFEGGLYCSQCGKVYDLSKLRESEKLVSLVGVYDAFWDSEVGRNIEKYSTD